jgi:hypothetical protein
VPIVTIDFGNGKVITRTLHGNIATYACTAEGEILDIVPGIYTPGGYIEQLEQLRLLANYADQQGKDKRLARLREYHAIQAKALAEDKDPARFTNAADMMKRRIEGGLYAVLGEPKARGTDRPKPAADTVPSDDLGSWALLAEDTAQNETVRRKQIHAMLAKEGLVQPSMVFKRLYKDVLNADLDDPYLGLGKVLFSSYPFANEEKR